MEIFEYNTQIWEVSKKFNKIKNCVVVKPPYEEDWYYSEKFFFDKRLWLNNIFENQWLKFYDKVSIKWTDYYYYFDWLNQSYIATIDFNLLTLNNVAWPFSIDIIDSPKRLTLWKWIVWWVQSTWTIWNFTWESWILVWSWWDIDFTLIPWYAWGYIAFSVAWTTWVSIWDYILFNDWQLKWWINRVEYVDWNWNVYIIWTNIRGTTPKVWDTIKIFKANNTEPWNTIIVWHNNWITACIMNWVNQSHQIQTISTQEKVLDITSFNGNIFTLTESWLYYSNSVQYSNMQMYALDRFEINDWKALFSMWKALLVFAKQNKLISAANWTQQNIWYVWYELNYNWDLYSKYSKIFTDQSIYILQKDKQLKEISLTQSNTSTFDVITKEVLWLNRWLFNSLSWWEVFIESNDRYIDFIYVKDNLTIDYQYDKMYQHIIEQEYNYPIFNISWWEYLSDWFIFNNNWYKDNWQDYSQEINFNIDTWMTFYMPYLIRTIFWLTDNLFNVNLYLNYEIWWKLYEETKVLDNFDFDNRLSTTLTWDEIIWWETVPYEQSEYNWTIVSIQSNIAKLWRFFNFRYNSIDRFMIWNSVIYANKSKPFINEPLLTN